MKGVDKNVFEGAGLITFHVDSNQKASFVLGARIKKDSDLLLDPTKEFEYFGGKPEGNETPVETAVAEFVEEVGGPVLEDDWSARSQVLHMFHSFSKKWIWCYFVQLTDVELDTLKTRDTELDNWKLGDSKVFALRSEPARKAIEAICLVDATSFMDHIETFKNVPVSKNRMKDAKAFDKLLNAKRLSDPTQMYNRRLRGFNAVLFENHLEEIQEIIKKARKF